MKKVQITRKLQLNKKTVAILNKEQLQILKGGRVVIIAETECNGIDSTCTITHDEGNCDTNNTVSDDPQSAGIICQA